MLNGFEANTEWRESEGMVHHRQRRCLNGGTMLGECISIIWISQLLIRLTGSDGPVLLTKGSDEFKPFIRRLPEFKFWYTMTKAFCIAFLMTFFSVFDVPVFWPILLCYWGVLFVLTMRRQIGHMIKYKYIPFNIGKQKYTGKKSSASSSGSRGD
ncbi:hypothetical protein V6N13_102824 [Hibiscus sabdariffa]